MAVCTSPKRSYEDTALLPWTEKLSQHPWEVYFSPQELSLGEEIFRNGEIRQLEVNNNDALVYAKFDQEECCTLLEWQDHKLMVRGSSEDKLLSRGLAVAGLYDIQKILEEKNGVEDAQPEEESSLSALLKKRKAAASSPVDLGRSLKLAFEVTSNGLQFTSFWKDDDQEHAALKSDKIAADQANEHERETLIRLASLARKAGFKFSPKNGIYSLNDLERIQAFFTEEFLSKWETRFICVLDQGAECIKLGPRCVDVSMDLKEVDAETFAFSWLMILDGHVLKADDALRLIRKAGEPVLVPEVGLVYLEEEKLKLLASWRRALTLHPESRIPRYILFSLFGEDAIRIKLSRSLSSWRKSLFDLPKEELVLPEFLRSYQQQGVRWLHHICDKNCHGLLADEMGLGKTVQTLSFLASRDHYNLPSLIVCPASVVPVWQREAQQFFPDMKVEVLSSSNDFYKRKEPVLWVASYAQLRMHKYLLNTAPFAYAILDEAQLIKNPEAKVTQACMQIRAKHRMVLTGTPLENRYLDLWSVFRFLMPGLLGTRKRFEEQIAEGGAQAGETIKRQIAPFVLRRTKQDVLKELPNKIENDCICPLTPLQREQYNRLSLDGVAQLGEDIPTAVKERSLSFLTLLTRLRQTCCDPDLLPWVDAELASSGKISVLIEKLNEVLANGHKVVIFSQFVSLLKRVRLAIDTNIPGTSIYELTGKTLDRSKPVEDFQNAEGAGVILVSLRAGGTGITLNSAGYVFLMDPWWNPAVEEQAIDRVHRFGQDKAVFVYRMITAGTVEERIQRLKQEKRSLFSGVLGQMSDVSNVRNYFECLTDLIALLPGTND